MRRPVVAGAVAGVLLGGGGFAVAQGMDGSGSYRTATASVADVDSTMALSGTVAAASRRDLSFATSGDVSSVKVVAGDTVKAGDILARLDPEDLDAAVTKAKAALARAEAQLESDQSAQSSSVAEAASSPSSSSSKPSGSSSPTTSPAVSKALARLKEQQAAVRSAQTAATEAITAAKAAVAARAEACGNDTTSEGDDTPDDSSSDACAEELATAEAAQDVVAARQDNLQKTLSDLGATLTAAAKRLGTSSSAARDEGGTAPSSGDDSSSTPTTNPSGGEGRSASAGSVAQDQAAIDTAKAELTEAKIARRAATLTAPFDGTVLDVSAAKGDGVSAGEVAVILVSDGGSTVTSSVTVDQVAKVKVGQTAQVMPAGFDQAVTGTVTQIGMLPTTSDDSITYPVTLDLADDVSAPEGAGATITLVTATAKDAVVVPSSAVTTNGARSTVTILKDGKPSTVQITVGAVGPTFTEIRTGLRKGQEIVLADLDADLPSGDQSGRGLGGGGLGGGPSFRTVSRGGPPR